MSSHPPPISELKLLVTQGSTTYEQVILDSASGNNSIQITNADILNAFNSQAVGSTFTPSIVTTYATGTFPSGDTLSTPSVVESFIPRVISLADIPNKLTTDASFNLSSLVTTVSDGVLSYSSSVTSVATVNSSTGLVTPVGAGTTTITVSQAATANHRAASASSTFTVSLPPPPISRASNNVTIQYTGAADDVPPSSARFIEANPRGTGDEWFAVVKDGMKQAITDYANGLSGSSTPFTPPGQSPVLFNNIVTTLMTDMSSMFQYATTFNYNISSWDTSNVTNMSNMFQGAQAFNQLLNSWDVSSVTNMFSMFTGAVAFNQPLNNWDVSAVLNMTYMFGKASSNSPDMIFNQNISGWVVAQVTSFNGFRSAAFQLANINMPQRFLDNGW